MIQSELDSQTAWETGYVTGTKLPRTSFIAVDNEGSHGLFPYDKEDLDRPVLAFFLTGKRPQNFVTVQGLPMPYEE